MTTRISVLRTLSVALFFSSLVAEKVRAEVIHVRLMGQNSLFSSQDSAAISTELNSILSAATGYTGSTATTTVLGGRSLTEGFYSPFHRTTTRAALAGNYDYHVILPETGFLAGYPEAVFEGVLQMSRKALDVGATPLLLMPGASASQVSSFGPQVYRIANGCGIDAVPGGYAIQAGGLLGASSALDLKRHAYLLAATLFTKITGLNAATESSYVPTHSGSPIDFANLASIAETTLSTHSQTTHYSTSRETTGRVRFRPITPANNLVRYAWTGTSTETGIKDALNPMLTASGYAVIDSRISGGAEWDTAKFNAAKPTFDANPNQFLFVYARTGAITLSGSSLTNYNQANLIPISFDRHYDSIGQGTASINNMLDDVFNRGMSDAEFENSTYGWATIPVHLGVARLNDFDPTIVFSTDSVHVTSPVYNMMASMMVTSALGRDPTPTAGILASAPDLKGFNVGKQIIKQLAFLSESEAFVPDTQLAIVGTPSLAVTKGLTVDHTFTATNGTPPFTWSEQSTAGLPPGLTLSPSGRLTGVTTANPSSWQLVLRVKDSTGALRKLPQMLAVTTLPAGTSALLSSLTPGIGTISPSFGSNVFSYGTTVSPATTSFTVTPVAAESTATIRVNGNPVVSGASSAPISLSFGPNIITTEVVSQDLSQTQSYSLTVTRAAFSSNADLAGLVPSDGTLSPSFSSSTLNYTATVFDIPQLTVTPTTADPYAIIRVNGNLVNSGGPSLPISLNIGNTSITIEVQSSDLSTTKTYLFEVTREVTNLRWWDGGSVNIAGLGDGISQGAASGVWNTTIQNWDQGNGRAHVGWENVGAKTAIFGGTPGTVTAQNVTVGGMTFSSAYTVTGGNITFANSGTISNSAAVTITSAIGSVGSMTKDGLGTLTLSSSSNVFNGGTLVTAGRLILENNLASNPNFTIAQGATLELKLGTNSQLSQGTISGAGGLVKSGAGRLLLGAQNNPQTISLASGTLIDVQAGLVRNEWGNSAWTANKADLNVATPAFFDLWDGNVTVDAITGSGVINKAWSGTNTLTIGADHGSGVFSGKISNTNSHGGGYGGAGGGTLNLIKSGNGTQTLSGINTYTGDTVVSAGTLALVGGSHTSPISMASGASLGFTLGSPTTSTSSFNLAAGKIKITGTPTLPSHTLITSSSAISGTPVLHSPIPGYALSIDGTSLKLVRVLSYAIWALANAPTGTAAEDYDGDGVANGVEYVLGGTTLTNDYAKLPIISDAGNNMVITFNRAHTSIDGATLLAVEVGTSLASWPDRYEVPATALANNPGITVIKNSPTGYDTITLTLPKSPDPAKFARLHVTAQ